MSLGSKIAQDRNEMDLTTEALAQLTGVSTETYCGKSCADCPCKEDGSCSGCKTGPGNQNNGDCEISKCCRSKGHTLCTGCNLREHCGNFLSRRDMPTQRRKKQEAEAYLAAELHDRAAFLGRWLHSLMGAILFESLGILFAVQNFKGLEAFRYPGIIVAIFFAAHCGAILLWVSKKEEKYRTAGICTLVAAAINLITVTVFRNDRILSPLFFFFSSILMLVAFYFEVKGHISALTGFDHALATKWEKLLICFWATSGVLLANIVLVERLSKFGEYILVVVVFFWFVELFMYVLYLTRTVKRFRLHGKKKG